MPKRLTLVPHLHGETLEQRYRNATDAVERTITKSCGYWQRAKRQSKLLK